MRFPTKPYILEFDIIGYEFPFNPDAHSSDNNWLITRYKLINPKDNTVIVDSEGSNLETRELQKFLNLLKIEQPFSLFTNEQVYKIELKQNKNNMKSMHITLWHYDKGEKMVILEITDEVHSNLISQLSQAVLKYPTR
ncbi:hypothetical protein [Candidatus Xianfuyuplasma coldseepsis]|uniref:Uncharacterized protein n=1 Tax=Candidatus Xianfuyuplasma coldseepsis TaxID=2782163 RepID=A0A7L7KQL1_9MOLU|nr:hypothetical protein [Xianfuyuplasma coldseepsis]QMS85100.1 hypothetical protein G4Z02_04865 [Xianfuyuplasma coldseepsis]